jgi:predicted N-acetyltransferase YhbS
MNKISIRPAHPEDYPRIGELTVAAYQEIEITNNPVVDDYMAELRNVKARAKDADVLVAVNETGAVLGAVTLVLDTSSPMAEWDEPGVAGFRMLAVAPEAQGKGVGKLLAEHCVTRAREAGAHAVLIHSRHTMTAARGIYAQMGFRRYPEIDFAVEDIQLDGFRLGL